MSSEESVPKKEDMYSTPAATAAHAQNFSLEQSEVASTQRQRIEEEHQIALEQELEILLVTRKIREAKLARLQREADEEADRDTFKDTPAIERGLGGSASARGIDRSSPERNQVQTGPHFGRTQSPMVDVGTAAPSSRESDSPGHSYGFYQHTTSVSVKMVEKELSLARLDTSDS